MARIPTFSQKSGLSPNNMLYETFARVQSAMGQSLRQGRLVATSVQAASSITVDNPVVRVSGIATVHTINAPGFGSPLYFFAEDGFSFGTQGNVFAGLVLNAGDAAIAQFDAIKQKWFLIGGGGPAPTGYVTDGANVGGGAEVFKSKVGTVLHHRTLKATGLATATQNTDDVTIDVPVSSVPVTALSNVGAGSEVYKGMSGTTAQIRKVNAGTGISVTQNTDDITIVNTAPHVAQALTHKQIAYGDAGNLITSEAPFRRETEGSLNVIYADNFWTKRAPEINVKWFGALGDGATDDTVAIQAAIHFASNVDGAGTTGTVYFPAGAYVVGRTAGTGLVHEAGVNYRGEGGHRITGSYLMWRPYSTGAVVDVGGVILDTTHIDISFCSIENLVFSKHVGVATGKVTGILGGCNTIGEYNCGSVTFRDLSFFSLQYGVRGNGAGYDPVGAATIGFFDSLFENIHYADCEYGVLTGGSGNIHLKPFFIQCTGAAIVMDYISAESNSGEICNGGIFVRNKYDIYFYDGAAAGGGTSLYEVYRQTNFFGTWFESSTHGIIGYDATITGNAIIPCLNFQGCMLNTSVQAPTGYLIDGTKIKGRLNVNECSVYKGVAAHNDQILGGADTKLTVRDCMEINTAGWAAPVYFGTDAGLMAIVAAAPAAGNILAAATTVLIWDVIGATPGMYDFDRETCLDAATRTLYTAKYSNTHRVSVTIMLDGFAVTESVDLRISVIPVGGAAPGTTVAIFHQNGTGYDVSITVDTLVDLKVGDAVYASVYNPGAAKTQVIGTYGFTNPHYNTFKVTREF